MEHTKSNYMEYTESVCMEQTESTYMDYTGSLSFPVSKDSLNEEVSFFDAALQDAARRLADHEEYDAISNEWITKGVVLIGTYVVCTDAIRGGMGSVWRVHHKYWDVDLAMKRPQPRFFAEGSRRRKEEFIRECENWINLGLHPNIVSCYYVRDISGVPSIFSEWMENGSLRERIRDGSLHVGTKAEVQERILDIAIQTIRGLRYSHAHGLIHQDIKPGNILLSKEWDAKIADFGLARAQQYLENSEEDTNSGETVSEVKNERGNDHPIMIENNRNKARRKNAASGYTPEYCPYEQSSGAEAERWMDVYAWALTVIEMYAGKRLWDTGAEAAENARPYCEELGLPERLTDLLDACLTEKTDETAGIEAELKAIYRMTTGTDYSRPDPAAASDTPDSLNNRALSFLDLGMEDVAERCWQEALTANPIHVDSGVNEGLWLWRSGKITDRECHERITYLAPLHNKDGYRDEANYDSFAKLREQLEAEVNDGMVSPFVAGWGMLDLYQDSIRGRYSHKGRIQVVDLTGFDGDTITYEITEEHKDESGEWIAEDKILHFDVATGELTGIKPADEQAGLYGTAVQLSGNKNANRSTEPGDPVNDHMTSGYSAVSESEVSVKGNMTGGIASVGADAGDASVTDDEFRFEIIEVDERAADEGLLLHVIEPGDKIRLTKIVRSWSSYIDDNDRRVREIPQLVIDYNRRKIAFLSRRELSWAVFDLPRLNSERYHMPYRVSYPVPFRERIAQDRMRNKYIGDFRAAEEKEDFAGMLEAYNGIWQLPLIGDNSVQARMNRELMDLCRMPGMVRRFKDYEIRIFGHDPEDPLPTGIKGILPITPFVTGDEEFDRSELPEGCIVHDDGNMTYYFYPLIEDDGLNHGCVRRLIWDRIEQRLVSSTIRYELDVKYIHRIIAVSSMGKFLILELRDSSRAVPSCRSKSGSHAGVNYEDRQGGGNSRDARHSTGNTGSSREYAGYGEDDPDGECTIVLATANGYIVDEIARLVTFFPTEAVFLEDEQLAPSRGYLWMPGTLFIMYFELCGDSVDSWAYQDSRARTGYAVTLPEELNGEIEDFYRIRRCSKVVDQIQIATAGSRLMIITRERSNGYSRGKDGEKVIYIYRRDTDAWVRYTGVAAEKILATRGIDRIMMKDKSISARAGWSWMFFPAIMELKQKPEWELREFTEESRITAISCDLCSLLDAKGRPIYTICWDYALPGSAEHADMQSARFGQ